MIEIKQDLGIGLSEMKQELLFHNYDIVELDELAIVKLFNKHCDENSEIINIQDVVNNTDILVDTPDSWQKIGRFVEKSPRECYRISLADGKTLDGSGKHLIESNEGWIYIQDLKEGDQIITEDGLSKFTGIENLGVKKVYDFEVLHDNHRYWSNGISSHNTGKTFICLNICANAVKAGYFVFWCDTEGALGNDDMKKFNIDTTKVRYEPTKTVEKFKIFMGNILAMKEEALKNGQNPKFMVILDSMGMLNTEKEVNDLASNQSKSDMGIKAKQLRALFRAITLDMTGAKIPLIATNHTTIGGIGSYTGPTKESAGGDGPIFSFSNVLFFSKKVLNGSNDDLKASGGDAKTATGMLLRSRQKKSRSQLKIPINIHVSYQGGMNKFVGLEEYVTWDGCGIEKGKIMTPKEYEKQNKEGKVFMKKIENVDKSTGEITYTEEEAYFVPSPSGRFCVKHMGKSLPAARYLFTKEVFTQELLKHLDENVIKPTFQLPDKADDDAETYGFDEEDED